MKLVVVLLVVAFAGVYSQDPASDGPYPMPEVDLVTTEDPRNRSCNACEMEGCRRRCKETCRNCQYNFCHVDEGEYDCKCMRKPPAAWNNETEIASLVRVRRWSFPKKGRRIRNCKMH